LFVLLGAVGACSDSTAPTPVTPTVAVSPAPNATGVGRGDTVLMTLDMPMDSASCLNRFILHVGDTTGMIVPGHMEFADGYRQMMFIPDGPMDAGTEYFAHMRDSVMVRSDTDGMGGMGGMMGGQMMMFMDPPAGAMRIGGGMGWRFTTGT
jgi:hypothetical protein